VRAGANAARVRLADREPSTTQALRLAACVLAAVGLVVCAWFSPAHAQGSVTDVADNPDLPSPQECERNERDPRCLCVLSPGLPSCLSDEELRRDGWEFSVERGQPGSPTAGLFALTLGSFVHGSGHLLVDDRPTWRRLFVAQGISLAMFASGTLAHRRAESVPLRQAGGVMQTLGASLFVASWIADVLGATKGTGADLPRNTYRPFGFSVYGGFGLLLGQGSPVTNTMLISAPWEGRRFVLTPHAELGTDLQFRRFGLYAGYRAELSKRPNSFLEFGAGGFDEYSRAARSGRTQMRVTTRLSLDLGDIFRHLTNLVWETDVSLALDHYTFESNVRRRFDKRARVWHAPVGFVMHVDVQRGVNLALGYRHDRDLLVGAMGRNAGVLIGRLGIVPRNGIGIELEGQRGAFTRVLLGIRFTP
jgi:hypothetical protein